METDLKSHLKDWRSQQLNHLPSITNLAYAKPFLKLPQIQKKRANAVHLSQRIPHQIIYAMEAPWFTPAKDILHPPTGWQSHGLCVSEFQGCAVKDYNFSPKRFNWAYYSDQLRLLRLAVKEK